MDLSFIYFGNDWFAENRTSSHHIARRLSNRFPLLYVETPGLRAPKQADVISENSLRSLPRHSALLDKSGEHMWHISVPQIPFRRYAAVRKINESSRYGRCGARSGGFLFPHLSPGSQCLIRDSWQANWRAHGRLLLHRHYAALPDVDAVDVARMDEALTRRADVVFAASPSLVREKRRLNETVIYSPHGVDADVFGKAADLTLPIAEPARSLSHPIIGFFGVLDGRIDTGIIEFSCDQSAPLEPLAGGPYCH